MEEPEESILLYQHHTNETPRKIIITD